MFILEMGLCKFYLDSWLLWVVFWIQKNGSSSIVLQLDLLMFFSPRSVRVLHRIYLWQVPWSCKFFLLQWVCLFRGSMYFVQVFAIDRSCNWVGLSRSEEVCLARMVNFHWFFNFYFVAFFEDLNPKWGLGTQKVKGRKINMRRA
jgi:hypothetical protein